MRRKDREITDFDEMMKIIAKCDTCRLALFDDEFPYIVPLNFGTDVEEGQLYLYFHSAKVGTKLDLIRKNNKVPSAMIVNFLISISSCLMCLIALSLDIVFICWNIDISCPLVLVIFNPPI